MGKRFVSIWFRYLKTDWISIHQPELKEQPFVMASPAHGRMIINSTNFLAEQEGIFQGMAVADARAIIPGLKVIDDLPGLPAVLLKKIAEWLIRFTPVSAIDQPDGIILDVSGCTHLWGNEKNYLDNITSRLAAFGYTVNAAMTDTIGSAWAIARYSKNKSIIEPGKQVEFLLDLPVTALRLPEETIDWLNKLGLRKIRNIINMPEAVLFRRFGAGFIKRLKQARGDETEIIMPVYKKPLFEERLPSIEPIITATGIEIALEKLLESICSQLEKEEKGLRKALFKCYRVDGKIETATITTSRPSSKIKHLFKLFEPKINFIEPGLGIELFTLEAQKIEKAQPVQQRIWESTGFLNDNNLSELVDRLESQLGPGIVHRYFPDEHYWPERSVKEATAYTDHPAIEWKLNVPRPIQLLSTPETIEVTAPIPDYPPMLFRYKGKLHKVIKADGPERIEQEWWLQEGQHRDYYIVEDEKGQRYWIFRSGHYEEKNYKWYLHGFFG